MKPFSIFAFLALIAAGLARPAGAAPTLRVEAISSSAAYVTGDDVVVRVQGARGLTLGALHFRLNGKVISPRNLDGDGAAVTTTIEGLRPGLNTLEVSGARGPAARLKLTTHDPRAPLFAKPRLPLLDCATESSGLGKALDSDCSAAARIDYFYRSTKGGFQPLGDPAARPDDLASVEAANGRVPYIVRVESGVIDRGVYRIAVLDDGRQGPWRPSPMWNRRLVIFYGGGCGMHYSQGGDRIDQVLSDLELSKGFAYAISTNLVNQQFCAPLVQAETTLRLKEHVVKSYGPLAWTLGTGASGGSIQQLLIAEMFPGLLDGIQPGMSFPDSQLQPPLDCAVLKRVFDADPARWTEEKRAAVSGATLSTCHDWNDTFAGTLAVRAPTPDPANALDHVVNTVGGALLGDFRPCGVSDAKRLYDPVVNPKGLRCSLYDFNVGQLGSDQKGRARRPFDNVGVEYGLAALQARRISLDDFLALNAAAGGFDTDGVPSTARSVGDPIGIKNAYATGLLNSGGGGLSLVPIVNQRVYVDTAPPGLAASIHDRLEDFVIRSRLVRANGSAANQVIWVSAPVGPVNLKALSLDLATRWLDALVADPAPLSLAKVARLKPRDAVDACWSPQGERIDEPADPEASNRCNVLYPLHSEPRVIAGEPLRNDVFKCRLASPKRSDYGPAMSEAQWRRLNQVFPKGVCDYRSRDPYWVAFKGPLAAVTSRPAL